MQNSRMNSVIDSVIRATDRTAASVHQEMSRGVTSLAIVSSVAPLIGITGTVIMIAGIPPASGNKEAIHFLVMLYLSHSLWPTAFGLCVGVVAYMIYCSLTVQIGALDREMASTSARLAVELRRWGHILQSESDSTRSSRMFGAEPLQQTERHEWLRRHEREGQLQQRFNRVAGVALAVALILSGTRSFFVDLLNPLGAVVASLFLNAFHLAVCGAFLYPIWVWPLKRKPGALLMLSAILACCWAIVDFCFSWHHRLTDF